MTSKELMALQALIQFAREVNYNDSRYAPKDVNKWVDVADRYLEKWI